MNRINYKFWKAWRGSLYLGNLVAITNFMRCKEIPLDSWNAITESLYQKSYNEAYKWCAIKDTIRKGYKRVKE